MKDTHKHEFRLSYTIKYKGKTEIVKFCEECKEFKREKGGTELPTRLSNMGGNTVKQFNG